MKAPISVTLIRVTPAKYPWGHCRSVFAIPLLPFFTIELLQAAMRRGGVNPTDVEMVSIINKHDNTSGYIDIKVYRQQITEGNV